MPTFSYRAQDASGERVNGSIDATSRRVVLQKLAARNLRPVSVEEGEARQAEAPKPRAGLLASIVQANREQRAKVTRKVSLPFLTGLKELLACGIQAGDALQLMSTRLNDPPQKRLATRLWDDVRQGRSLSEAFSKQSEVFDESTVSLVEAGEATGNLNNVLGRVVANLEETKGIKGKLVSALAYPTFLIVVAFGLVLLFLFFLLPKIEGLLASLGSNLPLSTRLLIGFADWALAYGWLVALLAAGGVAGLISWRKTRKGRMSFDAATLRAPILGGFLRDLQILRFTQVLALLLENGITMVQSLAMAERSVSNKAMRERFSDARAKVTEGVSLSAAFRSMGYFDGMSLDIFTVGENTGNIVPGLKQMARQYGERIDRAIKAFLGVMSVGVLLFVFVFVGLVALGIISAVFQLSSSLSG